jgi:hypothetical protein
LADLWVRADGGNALVLPLSFASGPAAGQPADLVRIQVTGAAALQCAATNLNFSERRRCGSRGSFTYHDQEFSEVSAIVMTDPPTVTADPIPVTERPT